MTKIIPFRAVFDTNVIIAALKSKNPNSPTVELLQRWANDEFTLLYCDDLQAEYEENFLHATYPLIYKLLFLNIYLNLVSTLSLLLTKSNLSSPMTLTTILSLPAPLLGRPLIWSLMTHTCLTWVKRIRGSPFWMAFTFYTPYGETRHPLNHYYQNKNKIWGNQ